MAEPWDTLRASFPTNTEGLIGAGTMRSQVDELETQDALNLKIADIETEVPAVMTTDYSNTTSHTITDATYETLDTLTVTAAPAGTYEIKVSWAWATDSIVDSVYFRISPDGGTTNYEMMQETGEVTDVHPCHFSICYVHPGTVDLDITFEARKENAGDVSTVPWLNMTVTRVA